MADHIVSPRAIRSEPLTALELKIKLDTIEACAKIVEPKSPRPCDCERCTCHNQGDAEAVAAWDSDNAHAKAIRALTGEK